MGTARAPRSPAVYLLVILAALLTIVSGPSAAAHAEVFELASGPHIEGVSPHGDEATIRAKASEADLDSTAAAEPAWAPEPGSRFRGHSAAADARGPAFAVAASPGSGRSPPQARSHL